jgi:hypothetical protein
MEMAAFRGTKQQPPKTVAPKFSDVPKPVEETNAAAFGVGGEADLGIDLESLTAGGGTPADLEDFDLTGIVTKTTDAEGKEEAHVDEKKFVDRLKPVLMKRLRAFGGIANLGGNVDEILANVGPQVEEMVHAVMPYVARGAGATARVVGPAAKKAANIAKDTAMAVVKWVMAEIVPLITKMVMDIIGQLITTVVDVVVRALVEALRSAIAFERMPSGTHTLLVGAGFREQTMMRVANGFPSEVVADIYGYGMCVDIEDMLRSPTFVALEAGEPVVVESEWGEWRDPEHARAFRRAYLRGKRELGTHEMEVCLLKQMVHRAILDDLEVDEHRHHEHVRAHIGADIGGDDGSFQSALLRKFAAVQQLAEEQRKEKEAAGEHVWNPDDPDEAWAEPDDFAPGAPEDTPPPMPPRDRPVLSAEEARTVLLMPPPPPPPVPAQLLQYAPALPPRPAPALPPRPARAVPAEPMAPPATPEEAEVIGALSELVDFAQPDSPLHADTVPAIVERLPELQKGVTDPTLRKFLDALIPYAERVQMQERAAKQAEAVLAAQSRFSEELLRRAIDEAPQARDDLLAQIAQLLRMGETDAAAAARGGPNSTERQQLMAAATEAATEAVVANMPPDAAMTPEDVRTAVAGVVAGDYDRAMVQALATPATTGEAAAQQAATILSERAAESSKGVSKFFAGVGRGVLQVARESGLTEEVKTAGREALSAVAQTAQQQTTQAVSTLASSATESIVSGIKGIGKKSFDIEPGDSEETIARKEGERKTYEEGRARERAAKQAAQAQKKEEQAAVQAQKKQELAQKKEVQAAAAAQKKEALAAAAAQKKEAQAAAMAQKKEAQAATAAQRKEEAEAKRQATAAAAGQRKEELAAAAAQKKEAAAAAAAQRKEAAAATAAQRKAEQAAAAARQKDNAEAKKRVQAADAARRKQEAETKRKAQAAQQAERKRAQAEVAAKRKQEQAAQAARRKAEAEAKKKQLAATKAERDRLRRQAAAKQPKYGMAPKKSGAGMTPQEEATYRRIADMLGHARRPDLARDLWVGAPFTKAHATVQRVGCKHGRRPPRHVHVKSHHWHEPHHHQQDEEGYVWSGEYESEPCVSPADSGDDESEDESEDEAPTPADEEGALGYEEINPYGIVDDVLKGMYDPDLVDVMYGFKPDYVRGAFRVHNPHGEEMHALITAHEMFHADRLVREMFVGDLFGKITRKTGRVAASKNPVVTYINSVGTAEGFKDSDLVPAAGQAVKAFEQLLEAGKEEDKLRLTKYVVRFVLEAIRAGAFMRRPGARAGEDPFPMFGVAAKILEAIARAAVTAHTRLTVSLGVTNAVEVASVTRAKYSDAPAPPAADVEPPAEEPTAEEAAAEEPVARSASLSWAGDRRWKQMRVAAFGGFGGLSAKFTKTLGEAKEFKEQTKEDAAAPKTRKEKQAEREEELGGRSNVLMVDTAKAIFDAAQRDVRQKSRGYTADLAHNMAQELVGDSWDGTSLEDVVRLRRFMLFFGYFMMQLLNLNEPAVVHGATHAIAEALNTPWDAVPTGVKAALYKGVMEADQGPLPVSADIMSLSSATIAHALHVMQRFGEDALPDVAGRARVLAVVPTRNPYLLAPHTVARTLALGADPSRPTAYTDIVGNALTVVKLGDGNVHVTGPPASPLMGGRSQVFLHKHMSMSEPDLHVAAYYPVE